MADSAEMSTSNSYVKYHISVYQNSQSITNNTSNVTVDVFFYRNNSGYTTYGSGSVYCKINGTQYSSSVSSSQKITNSGITLFTWTGNISHNSDGTKTLTTSAWINLDTPLTSNEQSYSYTLSTIPRASTFSGGSGNIGETSKITITRASSAFTHDLYYQFGSGDWVLIATNVETSYTWIIPASFGSRIPNTNSGSGTLWCETYNGGTYVGNYSINFTFYVRACPKTFNFAINISWINIIKRTLVQNNLN